MVNPRTMGRFVVELGASRGMWISGVESMITGWSTRREPLGRRRLRSRTGLGRTLSS
jgi:hypothetical protein